MDKWLQDAPYNGGGIVNRIDLDIDVKKAIPAAGIAVRAARTVVPAVAKVAKRAAPYARSAAKAAAPVAAEEFTRPIARRAGEKVASKINKQKNLPPEESMESLIRRQNRASKLGTPEGDRLSSNLANEIAKRNQAALSSPKSQRMRETFQTAKVGKTNKYGKPMYSLEEEGDIKQLALVIKSIDKVLGNIKEANSVIVGKPSKFESALDKFDTVDGSPDTTMESYDVWTSGDKNKPLNGSKNAKKRKSK